MKNFQDFKAYGLHKDIAVEQAIAAFGQKSISAADDVQYRREASVAVEATVRVLEQYHAWMRD
jgi:hypothetical protein